MINPLKSFHPMDLARYEDTGGDMVCNRFTHPIGWLRHCQPNIVMEHKDVFIKNLNTFSGTICLLSSIDQAVRSAAEHCETYKVDIDSTLRINVNIEVIDIPVIEASGGTGPIPDGWMIYDEIKRKELDDYNVALGSCGKDMPPWPKGMDLLVPKVITTQMVWSSGMVPAQNALVVHHFKERWVPQDVFAELI